MREQEPSEEIPLVYREVAYVVSEGTAKPQVEGLLRQQCAIIKQSLEARAPGKLVQLAVFDHVFDKKPVRAPLGTLVWKDWRGEPTLEFPAWGTPHISMPPPGSSVPPRASADESSVLDEVRPKAPHSAAIATDSSAVESSGLRTVEAVDAIPLLAPNLAGGMQPAEAAQRASDAAEAAPMQEASGVEHADAAQAASAVGEAEVAQKARDIHESIGAEDASERPGQFPLAAPAEVSEPKSRRRAGVDLIGELFETMHELHFCQDLVAGADFVLRVLEDTIPSRLVFVHVFDINTRNFVLVAQSGATNDLLLLRTPDQDPMIADLMRQGHVNIAEAGQDERFSNGRWAQNGIAPTRVLCGAVRQGGRYLGLVELADPEGHEPFHESEANALEYICQQFAEFVSNRPIVLDPDVVLRRP